VAHSRTHSGSGVIVVEHDSRREEVL
jgi:hypothetical protein